MAATPQSASPVRRNPYQKRVPPGVRRAQILAAARQVITDHGVAGAKVKDIAKAAGIAEGVIYRHFPSKDAVCEAAVIEPLEGLLSQLISLGGRLAHQDLPTLEAETDTYHRELLQVLTEIVPLLGLAMYSDQKKGREFYRTRVLPLMESFYAAIDAGLRNYIHEDVDPKYLSMALLGTYAWVALDANVRGEAPDVDGAVDTLAKFFVRGINAQQAITE